jgi:hypothetical protein
MKRLLLSSFVCAMALSFAFAQTPGPSGGPGSGASSGENSMPMHGRMMRHDYSFGRFNTSGWSMMSADERKAHHDKMMGMKSVSDCKSYHDEHHQMMMSRAKEKGAKMPRKPRVDMCDRMGQRGYFDQKPKG